MLYHFATDELLPQIKKRVWRLNSHRLEAEFTSFEGSFQPIWRLQTDSVNLPNVFLALPALSPYLTDSIYRNCHKSRPRIKISAKKISYFMK